MFGSWRMQELDLDFMEGGSWGFEDAVSLDKVIQPVCGSGKKKKKSWHTILLVISVCV